MYISRLKQLCSSGAHCELILSRVLLLSAIELACRATVVQRFAAPLELWYPAVKKKSMTWYASTNRSNLSLAMLCERVQAFVKLLGCTAKWCKQGTLGIRQSSLCALRHKVGKGTGVVRDAFQDRVIAWATCSQLDCRFCLWL